MLPGYEKTATNVFLFNNVIADGIFYGKFDVFYCDIFEYWVYRGFFSSLVKCYTVRFFLCILANDDFFTCSTKTHPNYC